MGEIEKHYKALMAQYRQATDDDKRESIRQEIWNTFGEKRATLVTDMSGFTYLSHRYGSVHYLSMIEMMEEIVQDVVSSYQGTVVKCEADNTFCIFEDPKLAINASIAINQRLEVENRLLEEKFQVTLSCGIAYGTILVLEDEIYGQSVIIASKLGEDIATKDEILVSKNCLDAAGGCGHLTLKPLTLEVSKVEVRCYYLEATL